MTRAAGRRTTADRRALASSVSGTPPNADLVLAFDFGARRIGVAVGNLRTRTASPVTTLEHRGALPWPALDTVVRDWNPATLVVGVPEGSLGTGSVESSARAFAAALTQRYALPVETVDESLTSRVAEAELTEGRRSGLLRRRVRKGRIDEIAARLIAEQWMNRRTDQRAEQPDGFSTDDSKR